MDYLLPAVVGSTGAIAAGVFGYTKIRLHFPVRVNCWFCNSNTKVPYRRKDCFLCPTCKQYNGFNKDGDYNCDLPAQYCESLNSPPPKTSRQSSTPVASLSLGNGLCQTCNLYQAMKVKALAEFEPSHPDKFDEEVEVYERRLERLYGGLCRVCNQTLKGTLGEQDSWLKPKLIHWRLQQTALMKELLSPLQRGMSQKRWLLSGLLRVVCLCVALLLVVAPFTTTSSLYVRETNSSTSSTQQPNSTFGTWHKLVQGLPSVLSEPFLGSCSMVMHHEAGSALLLLALLLAAVALAGRSQIRMNDAAGCFLLVLLLAVCSGQQSAPMPELLLDHLSAIKAMLCAAVAVVTFVGLSSSNRRPARWSSPSLASTPRRSRASLRADDSACSSQDLSADSTLLQSPTTFKDEVSTAPPSVVSSACPPSSQLMYPSSAPSVVSSGPFSHSSQSEHLTQPNAAVNPFLNKTFVSSSNSLSTGPSSLHNLWPTNGAGPSGSQFTMKPSAMADNLDTSLGSLQIGTPKKNPIFNVTYQNSVRRDGVGSSVINGGPLSMPGTSGMGMTLRSHATAASRRPQTVNGIAQTSWVAGGYWGSPSKSPRIATNQHNYYLQQQQQQQQQQYHHQQQQQQRPLPQYPANEALAEAFPLSRSSSQSSGFVSHGSGSQLANLPPIVGGGGVGGERGSVSSTADFPTFPTNDHASAASETSFVWNYESCETSSQGSQRTVDVGHNVDSTGARLGRTPAFSEDPISSAASTHSGWMLQEVGGPQLRTRSPHHDLQAMRALSRLSSHDMSDDDLSLLGMGAVSEGTRGATPSEGATQRSPWLAFVLGMSVMANGFLAVVLYNNNILSHFIMKS